MTPMCMVFTSPFKKGEWSQDGCLPVLRNMFIALRIKIAYFQD